MAYKSLLSFVTSETGIENVLDAAISMAKRSDAHLEVCCLAVDTTQAVAFVGGAPAVIYSDSLERLQEKAETLRDMVRARLSGEAIRWSTDNAVVAMGGIGSYAGLRARYCDLVVLPSPYGDGRGPQDELVIEAALFDGDAPVLVVPPTLTELPDFKRIVLAWNQSDEALHAARAALPLLKAADLVNVLVIDPPSHGQERSDPGGLLTTMMARHGVKGEVSVIASAGIGIPNTLQRHMRDKAGDLLVMGAYSHSRLRQAILGGTTRSLLTEAGSPIFMMH